MMKQIPNIFTLLNLVFGCLAIICILQTGETIVVLGEGSASINLPEKIWWGSFFIFFAALIDFLDGFVARLLQADSAMGKQLDSLADVVSFGVAPGLILYQLLRISYAQLENGIDTPMWLLLPALLVPAAGAWRLARFNIDTTQTNGFKGVPIPAVGLLIASLPLIFRFSNQEQVNSILLNRWVLYAIIGVVSWLMVSTLPLLALKFKDFNIKNNLPQFILIAIALLAAIFLHWLAVPIVFIAYILLSLAFKK
jgi:CDP-diacylglycerol---serine O-phosphatidyltransferase